MPVYTVRNETAGAAATKVFIELTAPANARVKIRGLAIGNTAATAAQGVEWELHRQSATATGTSQTPSPLDPDAAAARSTAKSTITANGTASTILAEWGFDIVGTYIKWFPDGVWPWFVNSGIVALRKTVGADTSNWAITIYFEE